MMHPHITKRQATSSQTEAKTATYSEKENLKNNFKKKVESVRKPVTLTSTSSNIFFSLENKESEKSSYRKRSCSYDKKQCL